jgi:transcriptional regulator with XRE-family HTH domain
LATKVNHFSTEICVDSAQSRAARGLLNWTQSDLVEQSGVSKKTIVDFERGSTRPYDRTLAAIVAAFEAAGIEFISRGVRMRAPARGTRLTRNKRRA